jgi:hypothetical protein
MQAEQIETATSPLSGSVVPLWSHDSMRSVVVSRSMWIVNIQPSNPSGLDGRGDSNASEAACVGFLLPA